MSEFNITGHGHVPGFNGPDQATTSQIGHATTEKQGNYNVPTAIGTKLAEALNNANPPIPNPKSKDGKWHEGDTVFTSRAGSVSLMMGEALNDSIEVKQGKSGPQVILGEPTITYSK